MRKQIFVLLVLLFLPSSFASAQPAPCTAKDGKGIVTCVEKQFPTRLVANISLADREANAKFLRDRVIETAQCAGLDVGLNLKRGGPSISVDFLAWKNGAILEGVDIISAWDDLKKPLSLSWHRYKAPTYGHPFFKVYGPVSCVSQPDPNPDSEPTPEQPAIDLASLWHALAAQQSETSQLRAIVAALEARVAAEESARTSRDDTHGQQLEELRSRTIPTGCTVSLPIAGRLRCRLE